MAEKIIGTIGKKDIKNVHKDKSYKVWVHLLERCYSSHKLKERNAYLDCVVCEEWKTYSNFKKWFDEHYIEGWQIDKDLFSNGTKIYSPQTCCYLPAILNNALTYSHRERHCLLTTGVRVKHGRFYAAIKRYYKTKHLGVFDTIEEAINAYQVAKFKYITEITEQYKDKLEPRVYEFIISKYKI